ncbi:MAG: pantetheine-phosphate adenylyltransferase [Deltaproteobacteria bacterium]|nr:pantetheine-phosphate adenylyltransferase [Deltaproteobacteria bacterium]
MTRIAFYPGSFDPITNGHVGIVRRGLRLFDRVIIGLLQNHSKTPLFDLERRKELIEAVFAGDDAVEVRVFSGLMVEAAIDAGAIAVLRGLRGVADFDYELQLSTMNKRLAPRLETVFLMTEAEHFHVSSKLVREVAKLGGDVTGVVPKVVDDALRVHFQKG